MRAERALRARSLGVSKNKRAGSRGSQRPACATARAWGIVGDRLRPFATVRDRARPFATVRDRSRQTDRQRQTDRETGPRTTERRCRRPLATVGDRVRPFATVRDRSRPFATDRQTDRQTETDRETRSLGRGRPSVGVGDHIGDRWRSSGTVCDLCDRQRPFATVHDRWRQTETDVRCEDSVFCFGVRVITNVKLRSALIGLRQVSQSLL